MIKTKGFILILLFLSILSTAQSDLITNTYNRPSTSLNGKWKYIVDPYETGYFTYRYQVYDTMRHDWGGGFYHDRVAKDKSELVEYNFNTSPTLLVPGDWNTQDEKLFYYEGTIWYRKTFDYKKLDENNRVYVYFGAINYQADVYLNGEKLGQHIGGFTPFNYEITDRLKEKDNSLIVKVDNKRKKEGVPTLNTDWWNYGGITRDVKIVEVPATFIQDYYIQLEKGSIDLINGYVQLDGENKTNIQVNIKIPELNIDLKTNTDNIGKASISIKSKGLKLWSPDNPKLYSVEIFAGEDKISDKIGFRTIETKGADILLNGKSIFLKGICIHEENPMRGNRAYSAEDAKMLLGWVKELNGNFARLAHYPHNENMARVADEMGILLWEEIPVYWTIDYENEETYANACNQLHDLIARDKNRASVIIWSVGNETPVSPVRTKFMSQLITEAHSLDKTRLVSAALEQHASKDNPNVRVISDPLAELVDVMSFNEYIGWYDNLPAKCSKITWDIKIDKPVIISEFGAGALQGFHGDSLTRWSEEFQADLYKQTLDMLVRIPQLRGITPWILADFRSPRRLLPDIQDGWNRKGIISQTGEKKKAFFVLQEFYKNKP
ncbi:MAG: beta galactosidase jelly roll domain-containing protein [Bacteroidales bacterium]|nr:beta galactosidase jelly roll domain-containing protein [Bacteroidales bacterium]